MYVCMYATHTHTTRSLLSIKESIEIAQTLLDPSHSNSSSEESNRMGTGMQSNGRSRRRSCCSLTRRRQQRTMMMTIICLLQHAFALLDLLWVYTLIDTLYNEVYSNIGSTSLMCNFEHSTQFNCTFIINKYLYWFCHLYLHEL